MFDTIPGLVVLGSIIKQAEQTMRSTPVSSALHGLCLQLLPSDSFSVSVLTLSAFSDESVVASVSEINPFLPK